MTEAGNKAIMERAYTALEGGDGKPFNDLMADDFTWIITGTTNWSGTYRGKKVVQTKLLRPLFAQFTTQYTSKTKRITAEGDIVVVETMGNVMTKRGVPYNNTYCFVCRMRDGKLIELTEYFDTQLVDAALDPPERGE